MLALVSDSWLLADTIVTALVLGSETSALMFGSFRGFLCQVGLQVLFTSLLPGLRFHFPSCPDCAEIAECTFIWRFVFCWDTSLGKLGPSKGCSGTAQVQACPLTLDVSGYLQVGQVTLCLQPLSSFFSGLEGGACAVCAGKPG